MPALPLLLGAYLPPPHLLGRFRQLVFLWLIMLGSDLLAGQALAQTQQGLHFGIPPFSGPLESRKDWLPLLNDLSAVLGQSVEPLSVASYAALDAAISRHEVDITFLTGKMALQAVMKHGMHVIAETLSEQPDHRALLLARKNGPVTSANLLNTPGHWRLAHGDVFSLAGYMVPKLQLFLPNRIKLEHYFKTEQTGSAQDNILAVANGDADLATSSSADLLHFQSRFPVESTRIKVLWESSPIPHAYIVLSPRLDKATEEQIVSFLISYGRNDTETDQTQRKTLEQIHQFNAFVPANNQSLVAVAKLDYELARESAMAAQWVSQSALLERLNKLSRLYDDQLNLLKTAASASPPHR